MLKKSIQENKKDLKDIWGRIKRRDFSGNTGLVVKNSIYQFSTSVVSKIGSLIFTIILARLLTPDLFGLYSLTLSTILIFSTFFEFGLSQTVIRFLSRELGKKKGIPKSYLLYIGKIKIILALFSMVALLLLSNYISNSLYKKPLSLALLIGVLYLLFNQMIGFFQSILQSFNNFRVIFKSEIISQVSKTILVSLAIILSIKYSLPNNLELMFIILFFSFSLFLVTLYLFFNIKKIYSHNFKDKPSKELSAENAKETNKFIISIAILSISGSFFYFVDKMMLGLFVKSEFIGYYSAAFNLISALIPLVGFPAVVLLPLFNQISNKKIAIAFKKSSKMILLFGISLSLSIIVVSKFAILIIYGKDYLIATNMLRLLSPLLAIAPLISIYSSYFLSRGNPSIIAKGLALSFVLNLVVSYFLLTYLIKYGDLVAVYGIIATTLLSQFVYLRILAFASKNKLKKAIFKKAN